MPTIFTNLNPFFAKLSTTIRKYEQLKHTCPCTKFDKRCFLGVMVDNLKEKKLNSACFVYGGTLL